MTNAGGNFYKLPLKAPDEEEIQEATVRLAAVKENSVDAAAAAAAAVVL